MQATPKSTSNNRMRRILEAYYRGGSNRVRAMLRRHAIPDEKIESILAHLKQNFPDLPIAWPTASTSTQSFVHIVPVVRRGKSQDQMDWMYKFILHNTSHSGKDLMGTPYFKTLAAIVRDRQVTSADESLYNPSFFDLAKVILFLRSRKS